MTVENIAKLLLEILFGFSAGSLTAAGFFAVVTSVGMINRIADVSNTKQHIILLEEMIIWGAAAGNIYSLFPLKLPIGIVGVVLYGLASGMFIGLFSVSLAENVKALPIFIRRVRIGKGLGMVILMIGLGKSVGHLIYYLFLYKQ
jgi:stage V sporulation protein AB